MVVPYLMERKYHPDVELDNGILVEIKGYFKPADRGKHLRIKKQHPELDIRFVFMNPNVKLSKKSKTRYRDWCDKHGFQWADKTIPTKWSKEKR